MLNKGQEVCIGALWLFLCFYFMQLFNFPNKLTLLFGGSAILVLLIRQKKSCFDISLFLVITTIASYFIVVYGQRAITMSLSYVSIIIYMLGYYLACEIKGLKECEKKYMAFAATIVVGYSVRGLLNSYLFLDGQLRSPNSVRHWMDIWAQNYMPGTWHIIFFLPILAIVFPAIVYWKKNKTINTLIFLIAIFFVYISMISKSRTSIVILPIVFFALGGLWIFLERKRIGCFWKYKKFWICAGTILLISVFLIFLLKDNETIKSFVKIMGRGGGILNNQRFKYQKNAIQQLFTYPMGGELMDLGHVHPHNTWLDMAYKAGLIPFFAFVAYTIYTLVELMIWLLKNQISTERKLVYAGIYGAFFLLFTIERTFVGSVHYMTPWLFVNALIHGELSVLKEDANF